MWGIGTLCVIIALLIILLTNWVIRLRSSQYKNGTLPPGSMGLPFIGETLQLLIPSRSLDIHPFLQKRIHRYGTVFRTNILGNRVVVSADPEVNHYLYLQEGKTVELWYMNNFTKLFGTDQDLKLNPFSASHRYIRTIIMHNIGTGRLKEKILPEIENLVHKSLSCWSKEESINVNIEIAKVAFSFMASRINYDLAKDLEDLNDSYVNWLHSLMSFPVNIPGTAFHDSLKKRDLVTSVIRRKVREKLNSSEVHQGDLLDQLIKDMKTETFMSEEFVVFFIMGSLFASSDTIASTLTLAFKLLSDHPSIFEELRAEHQEIFTKRKPGFPLTWIEYQSMTFTLQVINEVLRLLNLLPGHLRRATEDIQVNGGYIIPKGWTIMLASSAQHLNPNIYKDPLAFNPHRWKELDPSIVSKNFMPFGVGGRQCSGAEYAKVFISTFFHVLCTQFRWTKVKGGNKISRKPFLHFGDEIHIKVSE